MHTQELLGNSIREADQVPLKRHAAGYIFQKAKGPSISAWPLNCLVLLDEPNWVLGGTGMLGPGKT